MYFSNNESDSEELIDNEFRSSELRVDVDQQVITNDNNLIETDVVSENDLLKKNIEILLDWTVPKMYMDRFKSERRTTEEILEELTS